LQVESTPLTLYFLQQSLLTHFDGLHGDLLLFLLATAPLPKNLSTWCAKSRSQSTFQGIYAQPSSSAPSPTPFLSLCLTNVVVNIFSCQIVAFFISSTIWVNVLFTIVKFCYRTFKVSLASFSSTWAFSRFY
jgi:hypothetical protein